MVIQLPPAVASENVFIRYVLAGQKFGGWVKAVAGVSSYPIDTAVNGAPATEVRAILYAPGCALRTLSLRLSPSGDGEYAFPCDPVRAVSLHGRLNTLPKSGEDVQVKYVARWANGFLGIGQESVLLIPLGEVALAAGLFEVAIPSLLYDPGELHFEVRDRQTGSLVARFVPEELATRQGGLPLRQSYPGEIVFARCSVDSKAQTDAEGFAKRPDADGCPL